MGEVTVIVIFQAYSPFTDLLVEIMRDLNKQTLHPTIVVSEQPANGLIEKGKLYNQLIDFVDTEYVLFTDVDAKLQKCFVQSILVNIEDNKLDVVFATLVKKHDYRKTTDGIFILRKSVWLEWREQPEFKMFLGAKGIPTYLPLFIKWVCDNKKFGYEFDCPVTLRLPGNSARSHQRHDETKKYVKAQQRALKETAWISDWSLINGEWQQSPPVKDNKV